MRTLAACLLLAGLLVAAGCGGDDDDSGAEADKAAIQKNCGRWARLDGSSITAENVTCNQARRLEGAFAKNDCDFSEKGEPCEIDGYQCRRTSEDASSPVVFECTKGDGRVTFSAPGGGAP